MTNDKCFFGMYRKSSTSSRLVHDIFPANATGYESDLAPSSVKLIQLTDYAAQYPQYLPDICEIIESMVKSYKSSMKIGFVGICLTAVRELLLKCIEVDLVYIMQPSIVNILFQLFRTQNIQLLSKGANFFFEYSEICSKHDFSVFVKPIIEICEKNDYATANNATIDQLQSESDSTNGSITAENPDPTENVPQVLHDFIPNDIPINFCYPTLKLVSF